MVYALAPILNVSLRAEVSEFVNEVLLLVPKARSFPFPGAIPPDQLPEVVLSMLPSVPPVKVKVAALTVNVAT